MSATLSGRSGKERKMKTPSPNQSATRRMLSRWSGMFAAAIATFYAILNAVARPVSGEEASLAAMNFAVRTAKSFVAEETGTGPERLETLRSDSGNDLGYLVKIKDGPVVIVAAETRVRPIIAFSDSPDADLSEDNPALSLFREDLETRMRVAELEPGPNGKKTVNDGDAAQRSAECELEWQELLSDGGTGKENAGRISSIGDIRVPALMSSTWGQSTVGSLNTWNYYTPNNWVCGCVATAMAQLMRFHLSGRQHFRQTHGIRRNLPMVEHAAFAVFVVGHARAATGNGQTHIRLRRFRVHGVDKRWLRRLRQPSGRVAEDVFRILKRLPLPKHHVRKHDIRFGDQKRSVC